MRQAFLILLNLLFVLGVSFGQPEVISCGCPKTPYSATKASAEFHLPNGKKIALCGYQDSKTIKGETLYSEFVLAVCGEPNIIEHWGATDLCRIKAVKNTLNVATLVNLPVGTNMSYKETVWTVERIQFMNNKIVKHLAVNEKLPFYTLPQINTALEMYEQAPNANTAYTGKIADRLFISALSGSKKARYYLLTFKKKFTKLDGSVAEGYDTDLNMLRLWDKQHATE